jgi:hypothetical protein
LSSMAAVLRNCSGKNTDSPRRRGVVRGCQDALTRRGRGQGPGRAALLCGALVAPLCLLFGSLKALVNFWTFGFCFVQF